MNRQEPANIGENAIWYARMRNSATCWGAPKRRRATCGLRAGIASGQPCAGASPRGAEVSSDIGELSIEQFAAGDDHQVDARSTRQWLVQSENLSNQSFSTVSMDGVAQLP